MTLIERMCSLSDYSIYCQQIPPLEVFNRNGLIQYLFRYLSDIDKNSKIEHKKNIIAHTSRYLNPNAHLKFAQHALNRDTMASAAAACATLKEIKRYQIDIGICRWNVLRNAVSISDMKKLY